MGNRCECQPSKCFFNVMLPGCALLNTSSNIDSESRQAYAVVNGLYYQLGSVLGEGATSIVYSAIRLSDNLQVALKEMHTWVTANKASREITNANFFHELNPNLFAQHYDVGYGYKIKKDGTFDEWTLYIVMEIGKSLFDFISSSVIVNEPKRKEIFGQLAEAIRTLHVQGIVHNDIKPENVIIVRNKHVKLIDFATAFRANPNRRLMMPGKIGGTRKYSAPEKKAVNRMQGFQSDVYSLGLILFKMTFGFYTQKPCGTIANVLLSTHPDMDLSDLLTKMLKVNPFERCTIEDVMNSKYLSD